MSWETWSFAFSVTVPNLLMMLLGILLRRGGLMDDRFCDGATRVVFNLALPCLLFLVSPPITLAYWITCPWLSTVLSVPC